MADEIKIEDFAKAIQKVLNQYGDQVNSVTSEALEAGAQVLVTNLKDASPSKSGKFKKNWKINKKYNNKKYVGNSTTVQGKMGSSPLSNILEYSEQHGKPFIRKTFDASVDSIAAVIIKSIQEGV